MPIIPEDAFEAGKFLDGFDLSRRFRFFDEVVVGFLGELSRRLMRERDVRQFPDLVTFAYFCRKANLAALRERTSDPGFRAGWGTVLHVAPSNIPVNFAFSFAFSLLAGNSNIVRLPSRSFAQTGLFLDLFEALASEPDFRDICSSNVFVNTARGSARLKEVVANVDGLVVWGGDETVAAFRAYAKKPRCAEVYFPDRSSSAVIDARSYCALGPKEQEQLAADFFNDSFLVDQNACSSPTIIFWIGGHEMIAAAKARFWAAMSDELQSQQYHLDPVARIDRHLDLIKVAQSAGRRLELGRHAPDIWTIEGSLPASAPLRFGQFCEISLAGLAGLAAHLRSREQTITYFGVDPDALLETLFNSSSALVDRIVPVGKALDITPFWDGKDLMSLLSRRVEISRPRGQSATGA